MQAVPENVGHGHQADGSAGRGKGVDRRAEPRPPQPTSATRMVLSSAAWTFGTLTPTSAAAAAAPVAARRKSRRFATAGPPDCVLLGFIAFSLKGCSPEDGHSCRSFGRTIRPKSSCRRSAGRSARFPSRNKVSSGLVRGNRAERRWVGQLKQLSGVATKSSTRRKTTRGETATYHGGATPAKRRSNALADADQRHRSSDRGSHYNRGLSDDQPGRCSRPDSWTACGRRRLTAVWHAATGWRRDRARHAFSGRATRRQANGAAGRYPGSGAPPETTPYSRSVCRNRYPPWPATGIALIERFLFSERCCVQLREPHDPPYVGNAAVKPAQLGVELDAPFGSRRLAANENREPALRPIEDGGGQHGGPDLQFADRPRRQETTH